MHKTNTVVRPTIHAVIALIIMGTITISAGSAFPTSPRDDILVDHRSIGDYRKDVKTFMKLSKSDDAQLQRNAIFNLCELHWELVQDPRFESSQQVQGFRVVVARRLEAFVKDFKKEQLRAERAAKKNQAKQNSNPGGETGTVTDDDRRADTNGLAVVSESEADEDQMMHQSSAESYYALGQFSGGPNQIFGYAGGRLGPPWDHGPELVDLIENTINPDFWRSNGGNGSIHYFRPLRVLVIGASTQIHEDTLDLLYKLRAAGQ